MGKPTLIENFVAEATVSPYRIVKAGSTDDKVLQAAANTDALFGVSNNLGGDLGKRCDIITSGVADVEYGGAVTRGDFLTADANGEAISVTRHTHTENTAAAYTQNATTQAGSGVRVIGVARVSGVAGDIGSVQIAPAFA